MTSTLAFFFFFSWVGSGNVLVLFYFFTLKLFEVVFSLFFVGKPFFGKVIGCVKKTSLYLLQHVCLSLLSFNFFFSKFFFYYNGGIIFVTIIEEALCQNMYCYQLDIVISFRLLSWCSRIMPWKIKFAQILRKGIS
jgi:hypothetical protein